MEGRNVLAQSNPDAAALEARIECLQQLLAELLITNQRLRAQLAAAAHAPTQTVETWADPACS